MSIPKAEVPRYEEDVEKRVEEFEKQMSLMEKLINQRKINKVYRDSIHKMIYIRKKEISDGSYLLQRFNDFEQLNSRQKEVFLGEVVKYLNGGQYTKVDFGLVATELVWKGETDNLRGEKKELEKEIEKLKSQIVGLTETIQNLRIEVKRLKNRNLMSEQEKERLANLYAEALDRINELQNRPSSSPTLMSSSSIDTSEMASLRNQLGQMERENQFLFDSLGDYRNKLANVRNVRIDNPFWEPVQAKRKKKKGAYLLKDSKEIKFEFTLNYNYPVIREKEELKFIFFIAQSDSEFKQVIWNRRVALNGKTTFTLKEGDLKDRNGQVIKFKEGVYIVQVFHPPTSEDKPILIRSFKVVKAWF